MVRKLFWFLLLGTAMAQSVPQTPNYKFNLPPYAYPRYDQPINANFSSLDTLLFQGLVNQYTTDPALCTGQIWYNTISQTYKGCPFGSPVPFGASTVSSVFGRTGDVVAAATDYGTVGLQQVGTGFWGLNKTEAGTLTLGNCGTTTDCSLITLGANHGNSGITIADSATDGLSFVWNGSVPVQLWAAASTSVKGGVVSLVPTAVELGVGASLGLIALTASSATIIPPLSLGSAGCQVLTGSGAPAVAAPVCSLYLRSDGGAGTTLYVKESGTGTSGWVAK